ncbi:hypothetical protein, partial [Saccharopolyspora sp. NPDC002686]|uniref:hypothetical protein n=1 Tax=Saccharopolyspora sp. NPDC002686 TaxID=3154541 RepID=UPI00331AC79F
DDLSATHHLAITHHARAIDAENSEQPDQADEDWRQALVHWHRLFDADEFWTWLAEHVDVEPDLLPQVRLDLAERVVRLHFDIAGDERTPLQRARFHVQLALGSQFPAELVERVRIHAYEQAIAGLDAAVWNHDTIGADALGPAVRTVTGHLERDEDCAPALRDLLSLLTRVQAGHVQQANASDLEERTGALEEIRETARRYDRDISRLEPELLEVGQHDPLLTDLVRWHSWVGQACDAMRDFDEARRHFARALRAARAAADPRLDEIREDWQITTVLAARDHVDDNRELALELLGSVKDSDGLSASVLLARADTWFELAELDKAERDVDAALSALDSPLPDLGGADPATLRSRCHSLRTVIRQERLSPHLKKAEQAADSHRWADAIRTLDEVLAIEAEFPPALVLRAECYLGQFETDAAKRDLVLAERRCRELGDQRGLEIVQHLADQQASLHKTVAAHGGPAAFRLQQEGIREFEDGHRDKGVDLLRKAHATSGPRGRTENGKILAGFLNAVAVDLLNSAAESMSDVGYLGRFPGSAPQLDAIRRAEELLTEAASLDPADAIKQNLITALRLRTGLEINRRW